MNSALQCLRNINSLTEYLLKFPKNINKDTVTYEYIQLLNQFKGPNSSHYGFINPSKFKKKIEMKYKKYMDNSQHDSAEFILTLLNRLNEELKDFPVQINKIKNKEIQNYFDQNKTIITKLFTIFTIIESQNNIEFDPNFYLDLPISTVEGKSLESIEECLREFQRSKAIYMNNKMEIETTKICYSSDIIIFNLKRVNKGKHIENFVEYPEILNLGKFSLNYEGESTKYELIGLIKHIGNERNGHKIAMCKDFRGEWYEYNDDTYKKLSSPPLDEDLAFLFIYKRIKETNNPIQNTQSKKGKNETKPSQENEIENLIEKSKLEIKKINSKYSERKKEIKRNVENLYEKIFEKFDIDNFEDLLKYIDSSINKGINDDGYINKKMLEGFLNSKGISFNIPDKYINQQKDVDIYKLFKKYDKFIEKIKLENMKESEVSSIMKKLKTELNEKSFSKSIKNFIEEQSFSSNFWEKFLTNKCKIEENDKLTLALKYLIPKSMNYQNFKELINKYWFK